MLRPAVRARLEKSVRYHEAMAQYHSDSDKKDKKQNGEAQAEEQPQEQEQAPPPAEQSSAVEQYAEGDQPPGQEVAGEPVDTSQPGAETSTNDENTKAVEPEMQEGEKAEASEMPRHQYLAKLHGDVAKELRELLEQDEAGFSVAQARNQQPVRRDPAMQASARRSAIAQQMQRPGRPGGRSGLNIPVAGRH